METVKDLLEFSNDAVFYDYKKNRNYMRTDTSANFCN